jgi:hypothetical protein
MHAISMASLALVLCITVAGAGGAAAQTFDSGSTGADGAFAPTGSVRLAVPPDGVFHFTTVTIPAGVTVSFDTNPGRRHPSISLLATGNVTIAGRIDVSGGDGGPGGNGTQLFGNAGAAGPGGFEGGTGANGLVGASGGSGLGPGGGGAGTPTSLPGHAGHLTVAAGANGGRAYGDERLAPLVGGSGGGGGAVPFFGVTAGGGGGGGGGLLVASSGTITLTGSVAARGGAGGAAGFGGPPGGSGSGGAVRLVATRLMGAGDIDVSGGPGASAGRIRIEAFDNAAILTGGAAGGVTAGTPGGVAPHVVSLRIAAIGGVRAPDWPAGSYATPDVVMPAGTVSPVTVALEATQIPLGTTITVIATPLSGPPVVAVSTPLAGTAAAGTASAALAIPTTQPVVIGASAAFTLGAQP